MLFLQLEFEWKAIFVDEAQVLHLKKNEIFLGKNGTVQRSISGISKGLIEVYCDNKQTQCLPYAVFAGTEMSVEGFEEQSNSGITKPATGTRNVSMKTAFIDFEPRSAGEVLGCLSTFLKMDGISKDVQSYLGKWLRGGPLWAATLVEEFLLRKWKESYEANGTFENDKECALVQAMRLYLHDMTREDRRESW